jgi:hypothetical protein
MKNTFHQRNTTLQLEDGVSVGKWRYFKVAKNLVRTFVRRRMDWSIGIYIGESPINFDSPKNISNPVLSAKHVTDVPANFVADPFMVRENGTWYMFFEVLNGRDNKGDIGLAISHDGFKWNYSIRLYKAVDFPTKWSFVKTLLDGADYVDSSVFNYKGMWWMFSTSPKSDILRLYYANDLMGTWIEHPKSPLIEGNINIARPGGRVIVRDEKIFRYTQDDEKFYGNKVRVFEITELTTTTYQEKEVIKNPIIKASGSGWNKTGMHNIDAHQIDEDQWIACVDGYRIIFDFGIELQNRIKLMNKFKNFVRPIQSVTHRI